MVHRKKVETLMFHPVIKHNLGQLELALNEYIYRRHKITSTQALVRTFRDLMFNLYAEFRRVVPSEQTIAEDVNRAGWKLKVGPIAKKLAASRMGDAPDIWGAVIHGGKATHPVSGLLRMVRIGKKGGMIYGGRKGTGGRAATANEGALLTARRQKDYPGYHAMGKRETSMWFEAMLRLRGRRSLAVSFLHKRFNQILNVMVMAKTNVRAEVPHQGSLVLRQFNETHQTMRITSTQPGVGKFPGLVNRAIVASTVNIHNWFRKKHLEALADSLARHLKPLSGSTPPALPQ